NQVATDDRGHYRMGNVRHGLYILCAVTNWPVSKLAPSSNHVDFSAHDSTRYYARSCYSGQGGSPSGSGHSISIAPGRPAAVDLTVTSTSAASVRGRVVHGLPNLQIQVRLMREDSSNSAGQSLFTGVDPAKGTFEFRGVAAGAYRAETDANGQNGDGEKVALAARLPITVGTTDLDDIELVLEPTAEMEVAVHGAENDKLAVGAVSIGLRSITAGSSGTRWAEAGENGSLRFSSLPPDVYWLLTRSNETVCVQSAKLGEQEVLHGRVIASSAMKTRLDVLVSKHCGTIKGRVISNGNPVPDAKILLLLSGSAKSPGDLVTNFTDDRGEFSFHAMPFGRYQLWAWSVDVSGSFVGPANLADEEKQATSVDIGSAEPVTVEMTLLKSEGISR
ncbi:MAG: carboxypeptidase-like regulatory domain-containing protein, partial [Acidobacteriota bacterium]|nr:carboxypeptidase-like regulatory domain-containing protein [Acidobacteriota bacterium]